jgi:PAS domain S-box-containing protein
VTSSRSRWRTLIVRSGKTRARVAIVGFSVVASFVLVVLLIAVTDVPSEDWVEYLLPAVLVPLVVAPMASHLVLELAFELEAAAALAVQQEAQLRAVLDHAPVGIARIDAHGRLRAANPRIRALLGVSELDARPDWSRVFRVASEHAEFMAALAHARALEASRWRWTEASGQERSVRVALVPMPANADAAADSVVLVEDTTEREAIDAQLMRAQKLELVGQLAGGLAHDFNNLLTVVRANVAALGDVSRSPELAAIDDAADRGARLTRRLLSISRHDLLTRSPHAVAPLLHDTLALVRRVLPARLRIEAPDSVPPVTLLLDADAVQQALLNLMVNARDAMPEDGVLRVEVRVAAHEQVPMLVVTVADTGHGMDATVLARATEPFFTTKATEAGTGLGLAMVHATMQRHGGHLTLHSTRGVGTRAELWFPMASVDATLPPHEPPAEITRAPAPVVQRAVGAGAAVLLVEDEPAVRLATERALQRLGYTVTSTSDMASALLHLESGAPVDLVVTDVMMPGGTGVELLQAVRSSGRTTPILLVSGYAVDDLDAVLAADARAALLTKPWTIERLAVQVRDMLSTARTAATE